MAPEVVCTVSSCAYWREGNRCAAPQVRIDIDAPAVERFHAEFAVLGAQARGPAAQKSSDTRCATFQLRRTAEGRNFS
ncbi:MAG: hypothetical protein BLITH_1152 [Brockia lithotrophica]|uniref:DUF1540 domain-containing protein n=1 Tax=Brockia lithotrophica TaxID=933949 RepID=A0A2T5G7M0_9BACL|nr:DUF1540 domain-containing protein [Brockia lithotrophica]PTQ52185.1 MAG: hypothetical protein BLITH_1152 [Brockia lithotrophica]